MSPSLLGVLSLCSMYWNWITSEVLWGGTSAVLVICGILFYRKSRFQEVSFSFMVLFMVHLFGNLYCAYEILYFACFALIDKLNGWMPRHWVILEGRLSSISHKHLHLYSLEGQWWGLSLRARKITSLSSLNNGLASLTQLPEMKSHLPMG